MSGLKIFRHIFLCILIRKYHSAATLMSCEFLHFQCKKNNKVRWKQQNYRIENRQLWIQFLTFYKKNNIQNRSGPHNTKTKILFKFDFFPFDGVCWLRRFFLNTFALFVFRFLLFTAVNFCTVSRAPP